MNRTQQLKLLNDEIRRLFSEGINEQNAFGQLQSDSRFDSVRRSSLQSLYRKLKNDVDKEAKKEAQEQQLEERKRLTQYRQNAKNLLLYDGQAIEEIIRFGGTWQGRYFTSIKQFWSEDGVQTLDVFDFYQGIAKKISFSTSRPTYQFQVLSNEFILFVENGWPETIYLAQVDLVEEKLQIVQSIKRNMPSFIMHSSDRSKFLMRFYFDVENTSTATEICTLVNDKIEIGQRFEFEANMIANYATYFDEKLLSFNYNNRFDDMSETKILVMDLNAKMKHEMLNVDRFPNNICLHRNQYGVNSYYCCHEWAYDRLFVTAQHRLTGEYGVAFTDVQTRKWTLLNVAIDLEIQKLAFVNNRSLMVYAGTERLTGFIYLSKVTEIYKVPIRKPESLRIKAWVKTVNLFKKKGAADSYEQARKCLPLNSDVRGFFAADQGDD